MKRILFITCFFIAGMGVSNAQEISTTQTITPEQTTPVWPGCEGSEDLKECFDQQLIAHVQENYEYPMNDNNEYIRGKVTISFDINKEGEVVVNSIEGPEPKVNQAAREMINKIPKMKPGTVNGEPASKTFTSTYKF